MRRLADKVSFILTAVVCNLMVWGMFTVLNMPHVDADASMQLSVPRIHKVKFVATTGVPTRIEIPSLRMDIPVQVGVFDPVTEEWTLSEDYAYYASFSVPANDSNGTTLIYGHAKPAMFEPLTGLVPGMELHVYTDNSKVFNYEFTAMNEVVPTDTSVLTDVGPPTLVLQTCSGPWDAYRSLYKFDYTGVRQL